jgi:alcohol dehydrogenase
VVLSHPFFCPTRVIEGEAFATLKALLAGCTFAIVTSPGWQARGLRAGLSQAGLAPKAVLANLDPNPTVPAIERLAEELPEADVVVAFGGGSVIDAAKGALAFKGMGGDHAALMRHLISGSMLPDSMKPLPLIAIPTTAGTGSEVTRWGTIWGESFVKGSVSDGRLFPTHAILDPALLVSMPRALKLATGLDAASHAMEAVWNRRHGAATDALATSAIALLFRHLKASLEDNAPVQLLSNIQTAALLAGLAMGTTQTALAHSISYPFTARCGLPHGFACSFTLAEVARYNLAVDPRRLGPIADAIGCEVSRIPDSIERWFDELGLAQEIGHFVTSDAANDLGDDLITPARAANNLRDVDAAAAKNITRAALARLGTYVS